MEDGFILNINTPVNVINKPQLKPLIACSISSPPKKTKGVAKLKKSLHKINKNVNVSSNNLKFDDGQIADHKNPLQRDLSLKQHPDQVKLQELMSEHVNPNIEAVFSEISWDHFGSMVKLHPHLLSIIQKQLHFHNPTTIQVSAIKCLCNGRDALIKAQTGSGKTIAYAIPLLQSLISAEPPISRSDGPKALIILPTRELAIQTTSIITQLCRACIRIVPGCLVGGTKRKGEKASLRKGLNILISTPQRLLDHLGKTAVLTLRGLRWLVIDEADRLVELGFERDVRRIIDRVAQEAYNGGGEGSIQTALLSATLTSGVENLAGLALKDPVRCEAMDNLPIDLKHSSQILAPIAAFSMPSGLKHFFLVVPCKQRLVALAAFILLKTKYSKRSGKLIVFLSTQDCVDFHYRLFIETLCDNDRNSDGGEFKANNLRLYRLHGSMDHKERQTVFQEFSSCPNGILLTTDVASRGLDLAGVAWVVQYHVSGTPVDYVHRVGRTARAGGRGKALLMLQEEEKSFLQTLSATVGLQLQQLSLVDVFQTALFHLKHSAGRKGLTTVEEAAASMSRHFLQTVSHDSELSALAEKAYLSFLRSYASFSGEMRTHFTFRRLHLGHMARAFCLHSAPSDIASRVTGKRAGFDERKRTGTANEPITPAKSRRLGFDDETVKDELQVHHHRKKPKPSELANRNMLAEYGL